MRHLIALVLLLWPASLCAKPGAPTWSAAMNGVTFGIFCAIDVTGQTEAPGTTSGYIHTIDATPGFDWPGQRTVPASLGIAFGVQAQSAPGTAMPFAEMRVFRPGVAQPDTWITTLDDISPAFAFFRFDTDAELIPGRWAFEAWDANKRLYRVEFEVVPADQAIGIANACGGMS